MQLKPTIEKLASSGLSPEDGKLMQVVDTEDCHTFDTQFFPIAGMKIPYFGIDGTPTDFYRVRYLEKPKGFAGAVKKPQRYVQKAGTINEVYLAPFVNWEKLSTDPTQMLLITEGEFKGACACKAGFPTIALGGVDVWASGKRGISLLEPLDQFNWKSRPVIIVFDSDAATNPNVARAQLALAKMLLAQGALPKIATLPSTLSGEKQGLDDFLVGGGDLGSILRETRGLELGTKLAELNDAYAYVKDQDVVMDLENGRRIKRDTFMNGLLGNQKVFEYVALGNGSIKRVELSVPKEWLAWSARKDVEGITYKPGAPRITPDNYYNTWMGWGCEAVPGDITPWKELLAHLFGQEKKEQEWFEQWCAYPIQNPGTKLFTSVMMWGPETGTGKSLIGQTLGLIYGTNFAEIGNRELHSTFNEWIVDKQFILADEISGSDRRSESDRIKAMITQKTLRINMKFLPSYTVDDCVNYYCTSNHPDALFMEDTDRRQFVHRTQCDERLSPDFYRDYMEWLTDKGGKEALRAYFEQLDVKNFNPSAAAPMTKSKLEMVDHGRSDLSTWVAYFVKNMDIELEKLATHLGCKEEDLDILLSKHILWLYDPDGETRVTVNGMSRELTKFRFKSRDGVYCQAFGVRRFYVLRNFEKWSSASPKAIAEHIDKIFKPEIHKGGKF